MRMWFQMCIIFYFRGGNTLTIFLVVERVFPYMDSWECSFLYSPLALLRFDYQLGFERVLFEGTYSPSDRRFFRLYNVFFFL